MISGEIEIIRLIFEAKFGDFPETTFKVYKKDPWKKVIDGIRWFDCYFF